MEVHRDSAVWPERIIDDVGEGRQWAPESDFELVVGPPRQDPEILERENLFRIPGKEVEHSVGHVRGIGHRDELQEPGTVYHVIQVPACWYRGETQENGDQSCEPPHSGRGKKQGELLLGRSSHEPILVNLPADRKKVRPKTGVIERPDPLDMGHSSGGRTWDRRPSRNRRSASF